MEMRGDTRETAKYDSKFEALAQFLRLLGGRRLCACAKRLTNNCELKISHSPRSGLFSV